MKMRGIKPDFWTDEDVVEVSAFARLLFIGLWQMACDNGHIKESPRRIKMSILPADDIDIKTLIGELVDVGLVVRTGRWLCVPKLSKHQRIDRRYFLTCDFDGCANPPGDTSETPELDHVDAHATTGPQRGHDGATRGPHDEGEGEGEGEGEEEPSLTSLDAAASKKTTRGTRLAADFVPTLESRNLMIAECPQVDLKREHAKFADYWIAQPGQRGVKVHWDAVWRNWIRKAADDLARSGANGKSRHQQETDALFDAAAHRLGVTTQLSIEGQAQ